MNLAFAWLVAIGYLGYGLIAHLPIGGQFLGFRGKTTGYIREWMVVLFFMALVAVPFSARTKHKGETGLRYVVGCLGIAGLFVSFVMPYFISQVHGNPFPTTDQMVGWYVWGSHALFGLLGDRFWVREEPGLNEGNPA